MDTKHQNERVSRVRKDSNAEDRTRPAEARAGTSSQTAIEDDEVFISAYGPRGAETPQEAEKISYPFRKGPSLARTPPLKRFTSLPQEAGPATGDKSKGERKQAPNERGRHADGPEGETPLAQNGQRRRHDFVIGVPHGRALEAESGRLHSSAARR